CRRFCSFRFCRCKWSHERFFEIVNVFEILDRILLGFSENADADQIKDHVPDVFAGLDTPAIEHRDDHRAEFLERVLPDAIEQFWPRYMTHADSLDFLLLRRREVERIAQKDVPVAVIVDLGHARSELLASKFETGQALLYSAARPAGKLRGGLLVFTPNRAQHRIRLGNNEH